MSARRHPVVTPFYEEALTVNPASSPREALERVLAPAFRSVSSQEVKDRETLVKQIEFFWKLVPDLRWSVQELLSEGDRVVVRSVATGTPKGNFMGLETDGVKSFRIDTIDIHRVAGGKVVEVHHVEDWASALRQLKG